MSNHPSDAELDAAENHPAYPIFHSIELGRLIAAARDRNRLERELIERERAEPGRG